jgi:hypothetical protein
LADIAARQPAARGSAHATPFGVFSREAAQYQVLIRAELATPDSVPPIRPDPRGVAREWESGTMRKRLVRAVIFIAVATGVAVGAAGAAGATEFGSHLRSSAGIIWE